MLGVMPGPVELIVLAVILIALFGSKQLPTIARSLGKGVREVKDTVADADPRTHVRRALEAPEDEASAVSGPRPRADGDTRSEPRP